MEGGPGSKFKLNGLKGGQGPAVLLLEQTVLNLPQSQVDQYHKWHAKLLREAVMLARIRLRELLRDKEARKWLKLTDISTLVMQEQQMVQALAGYTTQSAEVPVELLRAELDEIKRVKGDLVGMADELADKIRGMRAALPPPGEDVIDVVAERVVARGEAEAVSFEAARHEARVKWLREKGYMGDDGKWTGKDLTETFPEWGRLILGI